MWNPEAKHTHDGIRDSDRVQVTVLRETLLVTELISRLQAKSTSPEDFCRIAILQTSGTQRVNKPDAERLVYQPEQKQ